MSWFSKGRDTLFLLCVASLNGCVRGDCPDGWVPFQGSCYEFGHHNCNFTEAQHYCEHLGANLVHPDSAAETLFLKSFLGELTRHNHWIGVTDRDTEGQWIATDDNKAITYNDFQNSEPNGGTEANCVSLMKRWQYIWTDDPCDHHYYPICEKRSSGVAWVG